MTPALQWEIKRTKVACSGGSSCDHGPEEQLPSGDGAAGAPPVPPMAGSSAGPRKSYTQA